MSGAPIIPRPQKQTTFYKLIVSKLVKPEEQDSRTEPRRRQASRPEDIGYGQSLKLLEDKKMNRNELLETAAGYAAGITTGLAFILLYVALAAPVSETVQKLIS